MVRVLEMRAEEIVAFINEFQGAHVLFEAKDGQPAEWHSTFPWTFLDVWWPPLEDGTIKLNVGAS